MTQQQSEAIKNEVNAVVQDEARGVVRMLENPMWQAIFASVTTISLWRCNPISRNTRGLKVRKPISGS